MRRTREVLRRLACSGSGGAIALALGLTACASDPKTETDANTTAPQAGTGTANAAGPGSPSGAAGTMAAGSSTGAAGDLSAAAGADAAGSIDCSALPLPDNPDDVIATFEEGTGAVMQVAGRGGGFYMFNDGTGMQTPAPGSLPDATPVMRCGSSYALCMSGSGFTMWGAGMGTDFAPLGAAPDGGMGTKMTYDASAYKGVAFWAKSNTSMNTPVRVSFKDKNTAPEGGQCDAAAASGADACNDDWGKSVSFTPEWQPYTVTFDELRQAGWGKAFTMFEQGAVYSIQFQVSDGVDFDLCMDDLVFVH